MFGLRWCCGGSAYQRMAPSMRVWSASVDSELRWILDGLCLWHPAGDRGGRLMDPRAAIQLWRPILYRTLQRDVLLEPCPL